MRNVDWLLERNIDREDHQRVEYIIQSMDAILVKILLQKTPKAKYMCGVSATLNWSRCAHFDWRSVLKCTSLPFSGRLTKASAKPDVKL